MQQGAVFCKNFSIVTNRLDHITAIKLNELNQILGKQQLAILNIKNKELGEENTRLLMLLVFLQNCRDFFYCCL